MAFDERQHLFANNAASRLQADISDSQTTIQVPPGEGARFPQPDINQIFKVTVADYLTGDIEIMHCTARSGDVLTVERAQEGTTAAAFVAGTVVHHRVTADTLLYLQWLLGEIS